MSRATNSDYRHSIVAYVEKWNHQFCHTVTLDGECAWIANGRLYVAFDSMGCKEQTNPDQWAFVHYFKRGELQITKAYAHVATNEVHSRVKMPTLHNNVADDYHREIEAAY